MGKRMREDRGKRLVWSGLLLVGAVVLFTLVAWPRVEHPAIIEELPTDTPLSPTSEPPPDTPVTPKPPTDMPSIATPGSLVPTRTPTGAAATQTGLEAPAAATLFAGSVPGIPDTWRGQLRWGVGVASESISWYDIAPLRLGWYLDWRAQPDPPRPGGIEYVRMIRLKGGKLRHDAEAIAIRAQANPGSLWLVSNEPDVRWQDNVEPEVYARLYHKAYAAVKDADPTAQVAVGGISQPTPLRLRYLEAILASYQEQFGTDMPVDAWHVHNFVLREERGSWGVDIPPGLSDERGNLYEIEDCGNLEIFQQQIVGFRRWMAERGYQDRPLIVSEYGIPMPEDYGYPPERVIAFLIGTFDFFLTATDPTLGYPGDGYRLVQRWCWYSLDAPDTAYPNGRLFDLQTGGLTAVGEGWKAYVAER